MSVGRTPEEREAARREREADRDDEYEDETPLGTRRVLPTPPARTGARRPPQASRAPGTGGRLRLGRALALLGLLVVLAAGWFLISLYEPGKGKGHGSVVVQVPAGASAGKIGDLLAARGVVGSSFFFSLRAKLSGDKDKLRSGPFRLREDMSYGAALDVLTTPPPAAPTVALTIPEGRTIALEVPRLTAARVRGSYAAEATPSAARFPPSRYGAPATTKTLEGFLFPDTYLVRRPPTAKDLVAKQLAAFRERIRPLDLSYARAKHLSVYDVLIIASMVEGEARTQRDRPLIAAVIYNRLHDHIPLGIDATTRYALRNYDKPLTDGDFARSGGYDGRHRQGLPPTPINSPGLPSIAAAARPARVPYLYFVVRPGTCEHVFSSSYRQFLADQQRYSAARAAKGNRSPTSCG